MNQYIDLVQKIPESDFKNMEKYVNYTAYKNRFIGKKDLLPQAISLEEWLQQWSHSKQTLFKLMGNKLIQSYPFFCEKNNEALEKEITLLINDHKFFNCGGLDDLIFYINKEITEKYPIDFDHDSDDFIAGQRKKRDKIFSFINQFDLCPVRLLAKNEPLKFEIKYKFKNKKKTLQIPISTSPMRALGKLVDYFKEEVPKAKEQFEDFRIKHSQILNDKHIEGEFCISIHPFDFITMSDNSLGWTSCMNWINRGCFHTGTIEMMNSNNVVCCYLKAKNDFSWGSGNENEGHWNNKRWRNLAYVTKDIICMGKSYPYQHNEMSNFALNKLRELAENNINWTYSFGPEPYNDMKYFNTEYPFRRLREYKEIGNVTKHSIIFDTKGMYNDFVSDHKVTRMCIRNKVKQSKIISISGRANCLCCNKTIIKKDNYYDGEDYNDRYTNVASVFCENCIKNYNLY